MSRSPPGLSLILGSSLYAVSWNLWWRACCSLSLSRWRMSVRSCCEQVLNGRRVAIPGFLVEQDQQVDVGVRQQFAAAVAADRDQGDPAGLVVDPFVPGATDQFVDQGAAGVHEYGGAGAVLVGLVDGGVARSQCLGKVQRQRPAGRLAQGPFGGCERGVFDLRQLLGRVHETWAAWPISVCSSAAAERVRISCPDSVTRMVCSHCAERL